MAKPEVASEKNKLHWRRFAYDNFTLVCTLFEMLISFTIMILWGAVRFPTGMLVRRERILFNHTSAAFSLTAGGVIFDKLMGNETPYQLQFVYSIAGFILYGTALIIQLFNYRHFDSYKMAIMICLHVLAVLIFLSTAISIFAKHRRWCLDDEGVTTGPGPSKRPDTHFYTKRDPYESGTGLSNTSNVKQETQPNVDEKGEDNAEPEIDAKQPPPGNDPAESEKGGENEAPEIGGEQPPSHNGPGGSEKGGEDVAPESDGGQPSSVNDPAESPKGEENAAPEVGEEPTTSGSAPAQSENGKGASEKDKENAGPENEEDTTLHSGCICMW